MAADQCETTAKLGREIRPIGRASAVAADEQLFSRRINIPTIASTARPIGSASS